MGEKIMVPLMLHTVTNCKLILIEQCFISEQGAYSKKKLPTMANAVTIVSVHST
jgi:hypothetical protein